MICLYTTFASLHPAVNDLNNQYQDSEHSLAPLEAGELNEGVDYLVDKSRPSNEANSPEGTEYLYLSTQNIPGCISPTTGSFCHLVVSEQLLQIRPLRWGNRPHMSRGRSEEGGTVGRRDPDIGEPVT